MTSTASLLAPTIHLLPLLAGWLVCAALIVGVCVFNRQRIKSHDDR